MIKITKKRQEKIFKLFKNLSVKLKKTFAIIAVEYDINFKFGYICIGIVWEENKRTHAFKKKEAVEIVDNILLVDIEKNTIGYFKHYFPYLVA